MITISATNVAADSGNKTIMSGVSGIGSTQTDYIYFGTYLQSSDGTVLGYVDEPIKWQTLAEENEKLLLVSDQNLDMKQYYTSEVAMTWENSTLRSWMNGTEEGSFYADAFDLLEQEAVAETEVVNADNAKQAMDLNVNIYETFYEESSGICYDTSKHEAKSQLGNALAILCGAVTGENARTICECLMADTEMTPVSLSMICFKYDAWLLVDKEYFAPIILKDIENIYTPMMEFGSTTVWETEDGERDFDNAGSLCHGWSALPIYYYHILLNR